MRKITSDDRLKHIHKILALIKGCVHPVPVVMAGGAVRDALLNQDPKDYDVFLLDMDPDLKKEYYQAGHKQITPHTIYHDLKKFPDAPAKFDDKYYNGYIICTKMIKRSIVQVIWVDQFLTVKELLDSFDFKISQFAYDPHTDTASYCI